MWISKRVLTLGATALVAAASLALAVGAFGHRGHSGHDRGNHGSALIDATLAPSVPTDPTFHGVAPGGAPWVLKRGTTELSRKGRLELELRGLVIPTAPGNGT